MVTDHSVLVLAYGFKENCNGNAKEIKNQCSVSD